ncbi:hypothetical protein JD969_10275 [Planctomycetota bacterium]|nr:hypothetical protein JD969_10275 [Planctomycetota bacterium]
MSIMKTLDAKIAEIKKNPSTNLFIIADAKDADMAHGLAAPGKSPEMHSQEAKYRSLQEYRELIKQNVEQGLVDIMLMSASTNSILNINDRIFDNSAITPAIRANDTTDIWLAAGGNYPKEPSHPFRSATIDHAMCGKVSCEPDQRHLGADLGLYSITFNNDRDLDQYALEEYAKFRVEAESKGFRHFLEVFAPNAPINPIPDVGRYLNDMIARTLAGVAGNARPIFLKIPYLGPQAMEQLVQYDTSTIVGILGGSAGTTFDAFNQLAEAKKYGARVALYGRMINASENQLAFIKHLRAVADSELQPVEAVKSYHNELKRLGITPYRTLEEDLGSELRVSSYDSSLTPIKQASNPSAPSSATAKADSAKVDYDNLSQAEKVKLNLKRWNDILG